MEIVPTGFVQSSDEVDVNNFFKRRAVLFTEVKALEYPEMDLFPVRRNNNNKLVIRSVVPKLMINVLVSMQMKKAIIPQLGFTEN